METEYINDSGLRSSLIYILFWFINLASTISLAKGREREWKERETSTAQMIDLSRLNHPEEFNNGCNKGHALAFAGL